MKKLLGIALAIAILLSVGSTYVYAAEVTADPGFKSTWYQVVDENGVGKVDHGANLLPFVPVGHTPQGHYTASTQIDKWEESINDFKLFDEVTEMATKDVASFQINNDGGQRPTALALNDVAKEIKSTQTNLTMQDGEGDVNDTIIKFEGYITSATDSSYQFIGMKVDNGCVILVDGVKVFEYWCSDAWMDDGVSSVDGVKFDLKKDESKKIEVYFYEQGGGQILSVNIKKDDGAAVDVDSVDSGVRFTRNNLSGGNVVDPDPTETPKETNKPNDVNPPKTSDFSGMYVFVALSGITSIAFVALKKKKVNN